uniref:NADH-ubiquinone oxidoreductase chain 4 n=1 Tax=Fulvia mutica TaxID=80828 RepID=T2HG01_FULMU|nr:NADH dehydrogenase subunit 4 [Fulvia mutica]BAN79053.1 NADH dehydrogenase subunit 4 [Fulvia mutica]
MGLSLSGYGVSLMFGLGFMYLLALMGGFSSRLSVMSPWFSLDQLSFVMVILVMVVGMMSFISSGSDMGNSNFCFSLVLSVFISLVFFISSGFVLFFIFFEAGLIPLVALILGWGYQPERLQACMSLILYTVTGSLPFMMMVCWACVTYGSDTMFLLMAESMELSSLVWFILFLGFFVKMPVFGVHSWLPKAHVEAPVAGSMILAGVLLKFGCYGLMRVMYSFSWGMGLFGEFLMGFSIWGGVISSMICLIQADLKSLIAYSSISHMSLVVIGIFSCSAVGWSGALVMMFAHGLSSPLLFGLANYSYKIFHSRSMMLSKGLLSVSPIMSLLLFLACVLGMGCPPGVNFVSEVMLLSSGSFLSWVLIIPMGFISFLGAAYSLYLYSSVSHGGVSSLGKSWVSEFIGVPLMYMISYSLFFLSFCLDVFYM